MSDTAFKSGHAARIHIKNPNQKNRYRSPWSLRARIGMAAWILVCLFLFRPTPKPLYRWRNFLLRLFGAKVTGRPYVAASAIIKMPWLLTLDDRSVVGPKAEIYNLAHITLKARCVVSQYAYLCAGTHDITDPIFPLMVGEIVIGEEAFVAAKTIVLPGVHVGDGAVLGAGGVAAKDLQPWTIYAGNPCKALRPRPKFVSPEAQKAGTGVDS